MAAVLFAFLLHRATKKRIIMLILFVLEANMQSGYHAEPIRHRPPKPRTGKRIVDHLTGDRLWLANLSYSKLTDSEREHLKECEQCTGMIPAMAGG